ncbi:hypothetical protein CARUB_v10003210mg [Capsella rubella]|uniref:Non-specific lipid-transfer protein n=1 Tax=Capsella rubella TaxID=81985 RepID=R0HC14_9BRAS|nr:hypothetical protein CARUB_v10003210mg [Capsella rubella]
MSKSTFNICVVSIAILSLICNARTVHSITCPDVMDTLMSCMTYITGTKDSYPTPDCCTSLRTIYHRIPTTQDRQVFCECLENDVKSMNIDIEKLISVPKLCHVSLPVTFDPTIDCRR